MQEELDLNKENESSTAQSTAEKLRAFELKKNELLVKFLPVVESVVVGAALQYLALIHHDNLVTVAYR